MPISGSPKANMNSTTVSGQLRMTVTHAVPKVRSGATGATRHVAMIVPSINEPPAPHRQRVSERRNPLQNGSRFWVMASICHLLCVSRVEHAMYLVVSGGSCGALARAGERPAMDLLL